MEPSFEKLLVLLAEGGVHYASKADLIRWKEASMREKDRLDASALRQLQKDPGAFD